MATGWAMGLIEGYEAAGISVGASESYRSVQSVWPRSARHSIVSVGSATRARTAPTGEIASFDVTHGHALKATVCVEIRGLLDPAHGNLGRSLPPPKVPRLPSHPEVEAIAAPVTRPKSGCGTICRQGIRAEPKGPDLFLQGARQLNNPQVVVSSLEIWRR